MLSYSVTWKVALVATASLGVLLLIETGRTFALRRLTPEPFPGLSADPRLLPFLGSVSSASMACPPGDQAFLVAVHPLFHYELVTNGPSDTASQICLRAVASGGHGQNSLFFEEPASNFVVDLLRRVSAEFSNASSPSPRPWLLDVGANIGVFSVPAAAAGFPVIAIEATPGTAARLNCAAARNNASHLKVMHAAVVDSTGPSHVCVDARGGKENVGANAVTTRCTEEQKRIPTMLLDQLPQGLSAPTVLKLDVEGYELQALRGGLDWISSHRPTFVYMEVAPFLAEGTAGSKHAWLDAISFWLDLDYHAWVPGPDGIVITRQLITDERAGASPRLSTALSTCSYNIFLSQRTAADIGVSIPKDMCATHGARTP